MTDRDAIQILDAIRDVKTELKSEIGGIRTALQETREQAAATTTSVRNVEAWAAKLNGRLADEVEARAELAGQVSGLARAQQECPARLVQAARAAADATGQRSTIPDGMALQILAAQKPHSDPPRRSSRVEVERWKAYAALFGLGLPALAGLVLAALKIFG